MFLYVDFKKLYVIPVSIPMDWEIRFSTVMPNVRGTLWLHSKSSLFGLFADKNDAVNGMDFVNALCRLVVVLFLVTGFTAMIPMEYSPELLFLYRGISSYS